MNEEKEFYIDIDATIVVKASNEKEAEATFNQTYGLDPMFTHLEVYRVEEKED